MAKVKALRNLYQLKILLKESKPPIWRRIIVPSDITLDKLHLAVQDAMGWFDFHLHQFVCGENYYGVPEDNEFSEKT